MAVLGLGFMGSTHLKALTQVPGVEVAAVYSSDATKLTGDLSGVSGNLATTTAHVDLSRARKYTDIPSLLADPTLDAVDVCLPTYLHEQVTRDALRAGKHVLVEKPIALQAQTAHDLVTFAREQGRILMAAQVLRFLPAYQALADIVRSNAQGPLHTAMLRRICAGPSWSPWLTDPEKSGGAVLDLLIHDLDFCLSLFGPPTHVSATGYESLSRGLDVIDASLRYDRFAVTVSGGWHHPKAYPFRMEYTASFEMGTADFSSDGRVPTVYRHDGTAYVLPLVEHDAYQAEIEYFVACCRENHEPQLCPPHESAQAVALARLLQQARDAKGEWLPCSL